MVNLKNKILLIIDKKEVKKIDNINIKNKMAELKNKIKDVDMLVRYEQSDYIRDSMEYIISKKTIKDTKTLFDQAYSLQINGYIDDVLGRFKFNNVIEVLEAADYIKQEEEVYEILTDARLYYILYLLDNKGVKYINKNILNEITDRSIEFDFLSDIKDLVNWYY